MLNIDYSIDGSDIEEAKRREQWIGPKIRSLEQYYTQYIKYVNPGVVVRIMPDPMGDWPPNGFYHGIGSKIVWLVTVTEEDFMTQTLPYKERMQGLAVLAHEAGHVEQQCPQVDEMSTAAILPLEADAFIIGAKWAKRWRITSEYSEMFEEKGVRYLMTIADDTKQSGVDEYISKIRRLISE